MLPSRLNLLFLLCVLVVLAAALGPVLGARPPRPAEERDTLRIELVEGETKSFYVKIVNPDPTPADWTIRISPALAQLEFSAIAGRLNPGERCEVKFTVTGRRIGDYETIVSVQTSSGILKDRITRAIITVYSNPATQSLFLLSRARLARFFPDSADVVLACLENFADHYDIQGVIINVDSSPHVADAYQHWDQGDNWSSAYYANQVAFAIDQYLEKQLRRYLHIKYIIIIGDDAIIPYHRISDQSTRGFQESNYIAHKPGFTTGAAVDSNLILTDDLYADLEEEFSPTYLSLPFEHIVSRLVKSPTQITKQLEAFLEYGPEIPVHSIFVSSGDYSDSSAIFDLKDCADSIVGVYGNCFGHGHVFSQFIQNREICANYDLSAFASTFLSRRFDLYSINNHAYHTGFFMPQHTMLTVKRLAQELPALNRSIVHTVGCHTGMTNTSPVEHLWDFPSVFAQKGVAAYIANTAYSISSALGVNRSERLQVGIARHIGQGEPVGDALRNAKHDYWHSRNPNETNPHDDLKVILSISLFGLPYYRCVDYDYRFDVARSTR